MSFDVRPLTVPSEVGPVESQRRALTRRTSSKGSEAGYDRTYTLEDASSKEIV